MGTVTILPFTTKRPITMIGMMAGICWGADVSDDARNYKRGISCITSNHGRTLEFPEVYAQIEGYSAVVIREWYTHIGGAPTRLQASTRYIPYGGFAYITPPSIAAIQAAEDIYDQTMDDINAARQKLAALGIKPEDSRNLLPLGMATDMVERRDLRNVIDMSRNRMCVRAHWEYRVLFRDYILALADYSEEWARVVARTMHPKCEELGYCPEEHGCGKYPKREVQHGVR